MPVVGCVFPGRKIGCYFRLGDQLDRQIHTGGQAEVIVLRTEPRSLRHFDKLS